MQTPGNPRPDLIDLTIGTNPEVSIIEGRNGTFHINQLRIFESYDRVHVYLEGIGKRAVSIRGGLRVTKECFSDACREFLAASQPDDCQINTEGFCATHQKVHLRETAAAMEVPAGDSVTKEWNMRCPQCCSDEGIEIHASVWVRLHADGTTTTDDTFDGSHEWASEDPAQCRRCDFSGTVGDFQLADPNEPEPKGEKSNEGT